jgi:uncharacterized protein (TIGR02646 family)
VRKINKSHEPNALAEYRASQQGDYEDYPHKDELWQVLAREQRGLCCYCMCRIHADVSSMKVEHWRCQKRYPRERLDYWNMLGACKKEGQPSKLQCCDTKKGNRDLKWNPANPQHQIEARIKYGSDGTIYSDDVIFNEQLVTVLNLNLPVLVNNRKSVLDSILEWWQRNKPLTSEQIKAKITKIIGGDHELQPFCQIAVWWLSKKL